MKTYDQFIRDFKDHVGWAIEHYKPGVDRSLLSGTMARAQSFWKNFDKKLKEFESDVVRKGNTILAESGSGFSVDRNKLRDEISVIGKNAVQEFVSRHKPNEKQ